MIIEHDVLEHGDFAQRQQVVRWRRRFPFSFISDREYTIARRVFREEGWLFGITKVGGQGTSHHGGIGCHHGRARMSPGEGGVYTTRSSH